MSGFFTSKTEKKSNNQFEILNRVLADLIKKDQELERARNQAEEDIQIEKTEFEQLVHKGDKLLSDLERDQEQIIYGCSDVKNQFLIALIQSIKLKDGIRNLHSQAQETREKLKQTYPFIIARIQKLKKEKEAGTATKLEIREGQIYDQALTKLLNEFAQNKAQLKQIELETNRQIKALSAKVQDLPSLKNYFNQQENAAEQLLKLINGTEDTLIQKIETKELQFKDHMEGFKERLNEAKSKQAQIMAAIQQTKLR